LVPGSISAGLECKGAVSAVLLLFLWAGTASGVDLPELDWAERSDWINVRTDVTPAAAGDGVTDDTAAIQAALDTAGNGLTIYFPPGTYKVTDTLVFTGGYSHFAMNLVGHGRSSRLEWHGAAGGNLLHINGNAYSRYVGLVLDGRDLAASGFYMYNTQMFETSIRFEHVGLYNFTGNAVYAVTGDSYAMAEVSYENCVFVSCATGVRLAGFNDYNHTFAACDFIDCGYGIYCQFGNYYARDCYFSGSTTADIYSWPEHGSSVRRCKSVGSAKFIDHRNFVPPLNVQDCYVDGWTGDVGAIRCGSPTVTLSHSRFVNPPDTNAPVRCSGKVVLCDCAAPSSSSVATGSEIYTVPAGTYGPRVGSPCGATIDTFVNTNVAVPPVLYDAKVDYGAAGNGSTDDTIAIQNTINAARTAGGGAIAYLPLGTYKITSPLSVTGGDYVIGGSGYFSRLAWGGPAGGTIVSAVDPQDVRLENLMIGHHDMGAMNNSIDVEQTSVSDAPSLMTYDGVYVFGKYQKQPEIKGLCLTGLGTNCTVLLRFFEGNLRLTESADALVLGNITYEGAITVQDSGATRAGFLGILTRLSTINGYNMILRNNSSIVLSDFYTEQGDTGILLSGTAGDPPGRVVVQSPKIHFSGSDPLLMSIGNYHGQVFYGGSQMYVDTPVYTIEQTGTQPLDVVIFANLYYNSSQGFDATSAALYTLGNRAAGSGTAPADDYTAQTLVDLGLALDDLQRLGWLDLEYHHAHVPARDGAVITVECGPHGAVTPQGPVCVPCGGSTSFVVCADAYYHIAELATNGVSMPEAVGQAAYTSVWSNVRDAGRLEAEFAENLTGSTGTPEWWLAKFGWTNHFDAAATNDQDGDGVPTCDEFPADTIPTNRHSALAMVGIRPTNDNMWVQWKGGTWATQYLELRHDLRSTSDHWRVIYTNLPLPTPITNWMLDAGATSLPVYYRIKAGR